MTVRSGWVRPLVFNELHFKSFCLVLWVKYDSAFAEQPHLASSLGTIPCLFAPVRSCQNLTWSCVNFCLSSQAGKTNKRLGWTSKWKNQKNKQKKLLQPFLFQEDTNISYVREVSAMPRLLKQRQLSFSVKAQNQENAGKRLFFLCDLITE